MGSGGEPPSRPEGAARLVARRRLASGRLIRTRFAPSPTGDLHLGGAWTALASWILARRAGGACRLRIEDLDAARVIAGSTPRLIEDLDWLGFEWDEGPAVRQSERIERYELALARLASRGLVYACDCSRAEIARAASAPHAGEESVYPGRCRELDPRRAMKRPPAWRVRVPDADIEYVDGIAGVVRQNLAREVGDFVVRRGDGVFAYQLAVVVDDLEMAITDVVRGADLVGSTPRQIWLYGLLGATAPRFAHVPLVVTPGGDRLEKRSRGIAVRELREEGIAPERIVGVLAHALGLVDTDADATLGEIVAASAAKAPRWRRHPWPVPGRW